MKSYELSKRSRKILAERIKKLRADNGNISYNEIFYISKIHPATVSALESEKLNPKLGTLISLAKAFHISITELLNGLE